MTDTRRIETAPGTVFDVSAGGPDEADLVLMLQCFDVFPLPMGLLSRRSASEERRGSVVKIWISRRATPSFPPDAGIKRNSQPHQPAGRELRWMPAARA
jgi:hypothetical protein